MYPVLRNVHLPKYSSNVLYKEKERSKGCCAARNRPLLLFKVFSPSPNLQRTKCLKSKSVCNSPFSQQPTDQLGKALHFLWNRCRRVRVVWVFSKRSRLVVDHMCGQSEHFWLHHKTQWCGCCARHWDETHFPSNVTNSKHSDLTVVSCRAAVFPSCLKNHFRSTLLASDLDRTTGTYPKHKVGSDTRISKSCSDFILDSKILCPTSLSRKCF